MEEIKLALASNIIKLRTGAGMTQAELGEKLNYSDKTISKWERADSMPDVLVLKQIGDIFNVSVDDLLSAHDQWKKPQPEKPQGITARYSRLAVTLVALAGIWTLAILVFVILWVVGHIVWSVFAYAIPVSLITLLVFNSIWNHGKHNCAIVSGLVLSIIGVIYIALIKFRPWQLFLVAIPAEIVVFLSFRIRKPRVER